MPPSWLSDPEPELPFPMRLPPVFWVVPILIVLGFLVVLGVLLRDELRTSKLQSEWLSWYGRRIQFALEDGQNPDLLFPRYGPYNQRLGYTDIPNFIKSLQDDDFQITAQMRTSPYYNYFVARGLYPIYHPKSVAGLELFDTTGQRIYQARYPQHVFTDFSTIPPLLVSTLLFIENREHLTAGPPTHNPSIEWKRFFFASFAHIMNMHGTNAGGGSTLATQIEKFRFSPGGQTTSGADKLRQIASASLRVYLDGPDTRKARERIVLDYLNSTPLSARPGFGEVHGIGDGLWAWFGIDLPDAVTALNLPETDQDSLRAKGRVFRAALGLVLAQRRPSYYLLSDRWALDDLTDATLDRMADNKVISPALRTAARSSSFKFAAEAPALPASSPLDQKAVNALRAHLMAMLSLKNLYQIDRIDLSARTTLNQTAQQKMVDFLKGMHDRKFLEQQGFYGFRLLNPENDPSKINWSVVLYERTPDGNKLRVQADNVTEAFDMNEGMKLDLGSTAKLRTIVTYLEIVGELHRRYAGLSAEDLKDLADEAPDPLTLWAITWLRANPNATLPTMLDAALDRKYSGSPNEVFFTGGGNHTFANFEKSEDKPAMDLHEAFRNSVNLVFVRVMRDIVNYTIAQGAETKQELLEDRDDEARRNYLERFAEQEGGLFLSRFISAYNGLSPDASLAKLSSRVHRGATSRTILFRSLRPNASYAEYVTYMGQFTWPEKLGTERLMQLYRDYPATRYNLSDRAYITGVNPMELWLAGYLQSNPTASRKVIMEVSKPVRVECYAWLFHPRMQHAQDTRIRIILEADAFTHIQKRWARLGYPFSKLVPSFATAIGSSADRPGALAELVGIILNDGRKLPVLRFEDLVFAADTPFQTNLKAKAHPEGEQVLDPAIARVVRQVMTEVVDNGTAKRVKGAYIDESGAPLPVGGKTGTGDQRYDEYGRGGVLKSSRVVNRTATFAFYIGDHIFGTITAHVAGEDAADYSFTSALSAQMLRALAPIIQPLVNGKPPTAPGTQAAAALAASIKLQAR